MWTRIIHKIGSLCAIALIFFAVLSSLWQILTPLLEKHHRDFENWASDLLHMPVTIEEVHASWHIYWPEISFYHVNLLDKTTQKAKLKIQKVDVGLNLLQSLIQFKPVTSRILFEGAHLIVRRPENGKMSVEGFPEFEISDNLASGEMKSDDMLAWIFSQQKIGLENIDIDYFPVKKEARSIQLKKLFLTNSHSVHHLDADLLLKQEIPTHLRSEIVWQGDVFDSKNVTADIYLNLGGLSLSQWFAAMNWHGLQIKEGLGSAKIWLTWSQGMLQKVQTQLQFYDMQLHSTVVNKDEMISRILGKFAWERLGDNQVITGDEILIDFPKHLWPESQFYIVFSKANVPTALKLGYVDFADVVRMGMLTDLVSDTLKKNLLAFNPRGSLQEFDGKLTGDSLDLEHAIFSGNIKDLAVNAVNSSPIITHLTGDFSWTGKQGSAHLHSRNLSVDFKQVFSNPIEIDKLVAAIDFQKETDGTWLMHANHISVLNADVDGQANMLLRFPVNDSPWIDLTGTFTMPQGKNVSHYLPLQTFKPTLRNWLRSAFLGGEVTSGKAIVQGRLADFPFGNNQGKFYIQGNVEHIDFAYAAGWPIIKNIKGNLVFSQRSMVADVFSGTLQNIPLHMIHGEIPSIGGTDVEHVDVTGTIETDFADALRFIRESPLKNNIGRHFADMEIQGETQLKLFLSIPLSNPETVKVVGDVKVTHAELTLPRWQIKLSPLSGLLHFTENTIEASKMETELLGQPATLAITTQFVAGKPAYVSAMVNSRIAVDTLEKIFASNFNWIKGSTDFSVEVRMFSDKDNQVMLSSDLQGISINLPKPFGKKLEDKKPIQADLIINQNQLAGVKLQLDDKTDLKISKDRNSWKFDINNPDFSGQVSWFAEAHKLIAKLQRLYLQAMDESEPLKLDPAILPEINLDAADVRYQGKILGRVMIMATPSAEGMRIAQLAMNSATYSMTANGFWSKDKTTLQGVVNTSRLTDMLTQLGMHSENFICSKADMNFNLAWAGTPFDFAINKLSGRFSLNLGEGRIVTADSAGMGFGRMLNLFNLSTLPRRLSLDFSDVFEKGYSFDKVKGDFNLRNGEAYTVNTRFDGPIASIDIAGRIGLEKKDYDLMVGVTPYVTSSLWALSAYAAGPVAGAAALVADKLIGGAVSKATTHNYQVSGTWANPVWKEVSAK